MEKKSNEVLENDLDYGEDEDTQKDRYLTFHLGKEDYGIGIEHIIEIVGIQRITEVPDMPAFIKGVINLRGQVIPVMDVRLRFSMAPREYDDRTCVIVVRVNENSVGLIVDTVSEVRDISPDNIAAPPRNAGDCNNRYILGLGKVGDEVKILLDVNKLLFEGGFEQIAGEVAL